MFDEAGQVLLIRRGQAPAADKWSLPGGAVQLGESIASACAREVREETGLAVVVGQLVEVVERVFRDDQRKVEFHYVILDYLAQVRGGTLSAGDDCREARYVTRTELPTLDLTEGLLEIIEKARALGL